MMKLVLTAYSRVDQPEEARVDFAIIADEMQTVCSPVLAQALPRCGNSVPADARPPISPGN